MKKNSVLMQLTGAVRACDDKKAEDLTILELDKNSGAFTDYFLICSGQNQRQIQAISDEIELRLKREGVYPHNIEGYNQAEWVLLDYVDFVVHIFSETARRYYDLERLWRSGKKLQVSEFKSKPRRRTAVPRSVRKRA
jgi:ribosome-associated protein